MEKQIILNGTGINLSVGNRYEDDIIYFKTIIIRGTSTEHGDMFIINNIDSATVGGTSVGNSCNLSFEANVAGRSIFLQVMADDSGGNVKFYYEIL